jgi:hypothetical protein
LEESPADGLSNSLAALGVMPWISTSIRSLVHRVRADHADSHDRIELVFAGLSQAAVDTELP